MSWITPIGFLGLISLGVLILIYLLKPNFQKKVISSTFVWKLSLKYKKKRIPINYFRDLLILICQILIFTACSLILAQPIIQAETASLRAEKIIIIDASVNMRTELQNSTRFERAVAETRRLAADTFNDEGMVSVILATDEPYYVVQRATAEASKTALADIDALLEDEGKCSYAVANVEKAMSLAEDVLLENPEAGVLFVTGTEYIETGIVETIDVSEIDGEWNAAILDCQAVLEDNYYTFYIDVACYNKNEIVEVYLDVYNINGSDITATFSLPVRCSGDEVEKITFQTVNEAYQVYTFSSAHAYVREKDSFDLDNSFYIYGGTKQKIKIEYVCNEQTVFTNAVLMTMRETLRDRWDIQLRNVILNEFVKEDEVEELVSTVGFDFYIFEGMVPDMLPTDGLVFLLNPPYLPRSLGVDFFGTVGGSHQLKIVEPHPVNSGIDASRLESAIINAITITSAPAGYDTVLSFNTGDPALLVKNTSTEKIAIMNFGFKYTNVSVMMEFPMLMFNMFDYFIPSTITDYSFSVGETVTLRSRGETLNVTGPGLTLTLNEFPSQLVLDVPGIYTLTQVPFARPSEEQIVENFFVRVDKVQSNIFRQVDNLINPNVVKKPDPVDVDLLIYFIATAVALLFVEWILKSRES